jgi:hypothetical protein
MVDAGKGKQLLRMAEELDGMTRTVTSSEADFLDGALKALRGKKKLGPADASMLERMYNKYLVERGGDEEEREEVEEREETDDVDPEDFM